MELFRKKIVVTGGAGFLGGHVVGKLKRRGPDRIVVPRSRKCNLVDLWPMQALITHTRPDVIIHLAAACGGIGINQREPGRFFYENAMMGVQLLEEARKAGVPKVVLVGSVCAYPKWTPVPFQECTLWQGYPEETNAAYGMAKKMLLVQAQAYRQQYGFNAIYLLPANLYGPGDNFNPISSHVVPAIIRKCVYAKERGAETITLWGNGAASRDMLYVEDAAEAIVLAAERYDGAEPMNIGTGTEVHIFELARTVAAIVGYEGKIEWDDRLPNGQQRRVLSTGRAERRLGWKATTSLEQGLRKTVEWYYTHSASAKGEPDGE